MACPEGAAMVHAQAAVVPVMHTHADTTNFR